jgi:hypothetical protein
MRPFSIVVVVVSLITVPSGSVLVVVVVLVLRLAVLVVIGGGGSVVADLFADEQPPTNAVAAISAEPRRLLRNFIGENPFPKNTRKRSDDNGSAVAGKDTRLRGSTFSIPGKTVACAATAAA